MRGETTMTVCLEWIFERCDRIGRWHATASRLHVDLLVWGDIARITDLFDPDTLRTASGKASQTAAMSEVMGILLALGQCDPRGLDADFETGFDVDHRRARLLATAPTPEDPACYDTAPGAPSVLARQILGAHRAHNQAIITGERIVEVASDDEDRRDDDARWSARVVSLVRTYPAVLALPVLPLDGNGDPDGPPLRPVTQSHHRRIERRRTAADLEPLDAAGQNWRMVVGRP